MKQRILDALFLLAMLFLLYGLLEACSGADPVKHQVKPRFLFFSSPSCGPCVQFDNYCRTHPGFVRTLRRQYELVPAYKPQSHPAEFARYKVTRYPTFIATDSAGNELSRMVGWQNNPSELLRQLSRRNRRVAPPAVRDLPPVITEPPAQRPTPRVDSRVIEINERLQRRLQEVEDALSVAENDLRHERRKQTVDPAKERRQQQQVEALQEAQRRAEAEAEEYRQRLSQPVAPGFAPTAANEEKPEPKPAEKVPAEQPKAVTGKDSPSETFQKWKDFGKGLLAIGAAVAAPEISIPGTVAITAFSFLAGWWKRRPRSHSGGAFQDTPEPALPRDNSEIEQILSLRQQEQREPLHDAFFGVLFEDEYKARPDQSVKEAWQNASDRFNSVAPLSTSHTQVSSTTNSKG